jgi:hypothetical protein
MIFAVIIESMTTTVSITIQLKTIASQSRTQCMAQVLLSLTIITAATPTATTTIITAATVIGVGSVFTALQVVTWSQKSHNTNRTSTNGSSSSSSLQ